MSEHNKLVTLYSQANGSDKVYQLQLSKVDGGFSLAYANGKRGAALKMKPKTTSPLTLQAASKEFDKIIKKKKSSGGYVESVDCGDTFELSEKSNQDSGLRPKLLNKINEEQAEKLCLDPNWYMQPKWDGERRPVLVSAGDVQGTNRYGEVTGGFKASIKSSIDCSVDMVFDSEDMGSFLAVFDLLEYDGVDLRGKTFTERYDKLEQVLSVNAAVRLSPIARTVQEKQKMLQKAIDEDQEGLVFIEANAAYIAGRPNSGGSALKYKLYDECSVLVNKINDNKRSVEMAVFDEKGVKVLIGNVTIPANADIPIAGTVIEVRYLYAYPNGGSLFQPIFEKPRLDLYPSECKKSQLKYKPAPII